MARGRRIVVLGHTGFIGRHVLERLRRLRTPECADVIGISTNDIDLTRAYETNRLITQVSEASVVVFCASIQKWTEDSRRAFFANVAMVSNVLDALAATPPRQLIYFSSAAVYGESRDNLHIREDTGPAPSTYYGAAKFAAENLLRLWAVEHGDCALCILRPSLVYGEDNPESQYLPRQFAAQILEGRPVELWGDGSEIRNFVHVEDVARAVERVLDQSAEGVYNVCSPYNLSYREFALLLKSKTGGPPEFAERPRTRPRVDLAFEMTPLTMRIAAEQFIDPKTGASRIMHALGA